MIVTPLYLCRTCRAIFDGKPGVVEGPGESLAAYLLIERGPEVHECGSRTFGLGDCCGVRVERAD